MKYDSIIRSNESVGFNGGIFIYNKSPYPLYIESIDFFKIIIKRKKKRVIKKEK